MAITRYIVYFYTIIITSFVLQPLLALIICQPQISTFLAIWNSSKFTCDDITSYRTLYFALLSAWIGFILWTEFTGSILRDICQNNQSHMCRSYRTLAMFNFYPFFDNTISSLIFIVIQCVTYGCILQLSFVTFDISRPESLFDSSVTTSFVNILINSIFAGLALKVILFTYIIFCYMCSASFMKSRRVLRFFDGPTREFLQEVLSDDDIFTISGGDLTVPLRQAEFIDIERLSEYEISDKSREETAYVPPPTLIVQSIPKTASIEKSSKVNSQQYPPIPNYRTFTQISETVPSYSRKIISDKTKDDNIIVQLEHK